MFEIPRKIHSYVCDTIHAYARDMTDLMFVCDITIAYCRRSFADVYLYMCVTLRMRTVAIHLPTFDIPRKTHSYVCDMSHANMCDMTRLYMCVT